MNSVNNGFEYRKAPWRQADAGSNYNTIISLRSQLTHHGRPSSFIRPDEADVALPPMLGELP